MNHPVVFLSGMGRSGSTLLERLLGALPGWWSMGEVLHVWGRGVQSNEQCGCGEPFLSCPIWTEIGEKAFGGWRQLDVASIIKLHRSLERDRYIPLLYRPRLSRAFSRRLTDYNRILSRLYEATRAVTGASVLVDAGKHVTAALVLRHNPDVDLRIVHNIRDSRGVAFSFSKVKPRPSANGETMMHRMPPLETATRYLAYNTLLAAVFGRERRLVRYEDLITDPGGTVSDIHEWISNKPTDAVSASGNTVDLPAGHGISGNPMRSQTGPTVLAIDDEWRRAMPFGQRLLVTAITTPTLIGSKYPLWPRPAHGSTTKGSS